MKRYIIYLAVFATASAVLAFSYRPPDTSKQPAILLPAAYERAALALGSATNQFYCVGANLSADSWMLAFSATNQTKRSVIVFFTGRIIVGDIQDQK